MAKKRALSAMKGSLLAGVRAFFNDDREQIDLFLEKMAMDFRYPGSKQLVPELNRTAKGKPDKALIAEELPAEKTRSLQLLRDYEKWLCILVWVYGIPKRFFPDAEEVLPTPSGSELSAGFDAINLGKNQFKAYEAIKSGPYSDLRSQLWIYDNLERQSHQSLPSLKDYLENDQKYFERIHRAFEANPTAFSYIRVLSLPMDYKYEGKTTEDVIRDALDYCSFSLFKHICDFNYDFRSSVSGQGFASGFYILGRKFSASHYAIINHGEYVVREDFSYDANGRLRPELMYIDRESRPTQVVYKKHRKQIEGLLNESSTLMLNDLNQVYRAVQELAQKVDQQGALENLNAMDYQASQKRIEATGQKFEYIHSLMESID